MNKDDLSALYGALVGKGYTTQDLGDENTFRSKMADKNSRKELYDYVSDRGDFKIGSYDNYEGRIAPLFAEKQSVNTQQSSSVGAGSVAQQVSNEFDKANLPQSELSPYVRGKGADVEIFGVPLSDYNKMPPEEQSRVYSEAIERKKQEDKNVFSNYISSQLGEIDNVLDHRQDVISPAAGSAFIPSTAVAAAQRFGNGDNKEKQDRYTSLHAAKNLLDDANKLAKEAKKGDKGFFSSLGRGFKDKFVDADNWTMGLTDAAYSRLLRKAVEKEERGEGLSSEETRLLDAAAVNMATQAYFSSDMSRGYKAGTMTAESIPFMLEFAVNPISSTGNALAKGLLKHGLKKFGRVAASNMAKVAGRLTGDAVAAASMTATTGLGRVAAGANERMIGDIQSTVEDGEIKYDGRENGMDTGEAIAKSAASNFLENQSEMVFNAFAGGGKMAKEVLDKFVPGFSKLSNSEIAQAISKIRNNPTVKNVSKRTQFHGILGEYAEEVYNNLANIPLGEMSLEQVTDLDQNIDTFLGLAPTSVAFGLLGLGGMARESYSSKRNLRRFKDGLSESDKILFDELEQVINTGDKETTKAFIKRTLNDDNLTPEKKKENIFAVQDMAKVKAVEDMQKDPEVSAPQEVEANKVDIYRNYKRAERKLNSLIPTEIIPQLDNVTDIEQFAHDNNLNDNQAMVISDYLTAKQPFSQYVEQTNQRRAEIKVAAREQAMAELNGKVNKETGFVVQAKMFSSDKPVYLTGGNLVFNDDGMPDKNRSTERVYYFDEDRNSSLPAAPDKFDTLISINSPEEIMAQAEMNAVANFDATEAENLQSPDIPDPRKGEEATVRIGNNNYLVEVNSDNPDSEFLLTKLTPEGELDVESKDGNFTYPISIDKYYDLKEAELWGESNNPVRQNSSLSQMPSKVLEDGRLAVPSAVTESEVVYDVLDVNGNIMDSGIMPSDKFNSLADYASEQEEELNDDGTLVNSSVDSNLSENQFENELSSRVEDNETIDNQPSSEEIPSIPSDEKGNLLYHKAPVDVTIDSFHREELEPEEIDSFVQANKDASNKLLSTLEEKKPKVGTNIAKYKADKLVWQEKISDAKSQVEYWNSVDEEIVASRVRPGDKAAEAILSMGEPMTGEELAATMLGTGRLPVLFDSYKKETGGRNAEARGMVGLFASKANGGMTIEEAGEQLMLADQENGTNFFDPNDPNAGRNAIIDVLSGARTRGDLFSYIKSNREAMAERERQAEYDAYSSWTESNFGMKPEDYEAYEEQASSSIAERFKDFDEEEFYNNIINEFDEKQGEITGATASSEVLQGEGIVSPERTGASENEGGSIPVSAESGSEEGIVLEEAPVANQGLGKNENKILNADSNFISLPNDNQIDNENDEVSESIPQGEYGALSEEDGRIEEALSECRRRSSQNERYAQADSGTLSGREQKEIENRAAEDYAKEKGKWIPIQDVFSLGVPAPSGNENDVYLDTKDNSVYKVNNLMNSGNVTSLLERIKLHNEYFPQTKYELVGFSGFDGGDVFPVLKQGYVENATESSPDEINSYMRLLGFNPTGEASYSNGDITISDLRPRNVLKDVDGDIYVIDADFKKETPIPVGKTIDTDEHHNDLQRDTSLLQDVSASSDNKQGKRKFVAPELSQGEDVLSYAGRIAETKIDVTDSGINSENGTVLEEAPVANQNLEVESSDENGNPFAKTKDNNVDFGYITSETGLSEAPIRLVDGTTSYGKQHIEQNHGSQIRRAGFETVEDFVSHVSSNYNVVRLGNKYFDKNTYILEVADKNNKTLFIELSSDGTYWNVNSAGVFRKGYSKNKEVIWTAPALGHNSTTENKEVASSITGNEGSTGSTSGDSSQITSSENKDSEVSDNKQGKRKFVAPELSQGEDVLSYAGRIAETKQLFDAEQEVDLSPTEAQKEAGNYKKGHVKIDGYDITIENPKGSERSGIDANGQPWSVTMNNSYGYIRGTEGVDGDHIDIFLSENPSSGNVFVVDQMNEDGSFDEHKVMYGFSSADEAKDAYLANYSPGWKGLGTITEVSKEEFKKWVDSSKRKTKAFAEYKSVAEKVSDNENPLRFDLSGDNVSVTESKSLSDYKRVMNLANTFEEKYLGAGRSFVIKSNDTLRKQLEAIGTPESAITDIENKVLSGKGLACYEPNTDRTIIFNTSASDDVINGYLWHENTHRALDSVFGAEKEERINSVYEYIEPTHKPQFEVIRNSYSDRSEIEKKEECITYYFEDFFVRKGEKELEKIIDEASPIMKDFFKPIFNKIVYGREEGSHVDGSGRIDEISGKESSGMVLNSLLTESGEEKEGRRGKEESSRSSDSGGTRKKGVRFREKDTNNHPYSIAQMAYDGAVKDRFRNNFSEGWFDFLRSVQKLQDAIEKETGKAIEGFENVYQRAIQLSSLNNAEFTILQDGLMDPLSEVIARMIDGKEFRGHKMTYDDVDIYFNCKHGLERNEVFARRDAKDDKGVENEEAYLKNRKRDYSGLTGIFDPEKIGVFNNDLEVEAEKYITEFERIYGEESINKLWDSVGQLTGYALDKSYKCGLIGKKEYEETKNTFKHYVPLRGFSEMTSGDVYDYISRYGNENVPQKVLKNADGRSSRADNILATMMNMAHSSIIQGNKNLVKQSLMTIALNHRTSLLTISKQWYEKGADGLDKPLYPVLSDRMSAEEQRKAIESFEDEMKSEHDAKKVFEKKDGLKLQFKVAEMWEADNHCVRVVRGGKEYLVWINGNPKAAQALNGNLNLDAELNSYEKAISATNRFLARMQTAYSPEFIVRNLQRDILFSNATAFIKEGGKYWKGFNKNLKDNLAFMVVKGNQKGSYAGIYSLYAKHKKGTLNMNIPRERYFKEFVENGGETGYSVLYTIDDYKKRIDKIVKQANTGYGKVGKVIEAIGAGIEFANKGVENSCRFAAYVTSREMGRGLLQSVTDAKEISVNFNRKGSGKLGNRYARMAYTYMNPAVQSIYQLLKLSGKYPKRSLGVFGSVVALGFINSMATKAILSALGADDDDDDYNGYYKLSPWKRRNNICIWSGDGFITWQLPPELRVFYGIGEIGSSAMAGEMKHENTFLAIMGQLQQMSPWTFVGENNIGGVDFLKTTVKSAVPTAVSFFTDAYLVNENFLGKKITNAEEWNERDPEWKRCTKGTNTWLIAASRWMNETTGGNDHKRGWLENGSSVLLNPGAIEYLFSSYFGGLGTFAAKLSKVGMAIGGDEDMKEFRNIPIASALYTSVDNDYSRRRRIDEAFRYYENEFEVTDNQVKGFNKDWMNGNEERAAKSINQLHKGGDYKRWEILKDYLPVIKKLEKEMYAAQNSEDKKERDRIAKDIYQLKRKVIGEVVKKTR